MAPRQNTPTLMLEDAHIIMRNFTGAEGRFNKEGERNFAVIIPDEIVEQLLADGWNVKRFDEKEDEPNPPYFLKVKVGFKIRPPRIVLRRENGKKSTIGQSALELLDYTDFATVDLILTGSMWDVNGKQGMSAYLKTLVATIYEDELEKKYDLNDSIGHDEMPEDDDG